MMLPNYVLVPWRSEIMSSAAGTALGEKFAGRAASASGSASAPLPKPAPHPLQGPPLHPRHSSASQIQSYTFRCPFNSKEGSLSSCQINSGEREGLAPRSLPWLQGSARPGFKRATDALAAYQRRSPHFIAAQTRESVTGMSTWSTS